MSTKEHLCFFKQFIGQMYGIGDDYIGYPATEEDLKNVMNQYTEQYLPGCSESVDVVHVKWSNCPAGDVN